MQLVSNYPQVPLATSNPATDAARVESQQRPPVIPPQQASQGHEERGYNAQNERTADSQQYARLSEQVHERQQSDQQQQQQSQEQKQQGRSATAAVLFVKPALDRKDIRNRADLSQNNQKVAVKADNDAATEQPPLAQESADFYRELAVRIGTFYRQTTQPADDASLTALA